MKLGLICALCIIGAISCACPDGWTKVDNKCYKKFQNENFVYTNAYDSCRSMFADLAMLNTDNKYNYVKSLVASDAAGSYLGARASAPKKFKYNDGSELTPTNNWCPGEPNNNKKTVLTEDCLEIGPCGLNDLNCLNKRSSYICEIDYCDPDKTWNGTDCVCKPSMPWNGKECACPSGWTRNENICYLLVSSPSKFDPALTDCKSKNATIVNINTQSKYDFVKTLKNGLSVFIGVKTRTPKVFRNLDATPLLPNKFVAGEPNNGNFPNAYGCAEPCIEFKDGFSDIDCTLPRAYVCEYKP